MPRFEGGTQAFECVLLSCDILVYITVVRHGDTLTYNCYRNREVRFQYPGVPVTSLTNPALGNNARGP